MFSRFETLIPNENLLGTRNIFIRSAFLWAIGNTLTSNLVMLSLAFTLKFSGMTISFLLMAPWLAGTLRPFSLRLFDHVKSKKRFCLYGYLLQIAALVGVAWSTWPGNLPPHIAIWAICGLWAFSCLCEHCVYAVLLAWNRDFVPGEDLGDFFARRERMKLTGEILTLSATIGIHLWLKTCHPGPYLPLEVLSVLYTIFTLVGAGVLFVYVIYLARAEVEPTHGREPCEIPPRHTFATLLRPFRDSNFRWLLAYGLIFAFFTQFDQVFQKTLAKNLLGIEGAYQFGAISLLGIRFGQTCFARFVGRRIDDFRTLDVMIGSQCLSAFGILMYAVAFFMGGGYLYFSIFFWICYVGLNIALPKVQLDTIQTSDRASVVAVYGAATGLAGTVGIFLGGYLYGFASAIQWIVPAVFVLSFCGRFASAGVLRGWQHARNAFGKKLL